MHPEQNSRLPSFITTPRAPVIFWTLFALVIWFFVKGDFGITWDATPNAQIGQATYRYIFEGWSLEKVNAAIVSNGGLYCPAWDFICATAMHVFRSDLFMTQHALQGLLWVLITPATVLIARRLGDLPTAWLAGLAIISLPALFGHGFNNHKDLPLTCAAAWFFYAIIRALETERLGLKTLFALGISFGCVIGVRPGGIFLGALFGLLMLRGAMRTEHVGIGVKAREFFRPLPIIFGAVAIAWLMMIAVWPQAHAAPIMHPIRAIFYASNFDEVIQVLYQGQLIGSNALPWHYLPVYIALTTPISILLFCALGHFSVFKEARRNTEKQLIFVGLLFVLWFPIVYCMIRTPNIYDGMRHFMFVLPVIVIFAASGAAFAAVKISKTLGNFSHAAVALVIGANLIPVIALHPYQSSYYNLFAGDSPTLHKRYEVDYWVSSYREAAEWIQNREKNRNRTPRVLLAANGFSNMAFVYFWNTNKIPLSFAYRLGSFTDPTTNHGADYYVATVRYGQAENFPSSPIIHKIERNGVVMCVIRSNEVSN